MHSRNSSQKKPDGWGAARGGRLSGHARRLAAPCVCAGQPPALDLLLPGPSRPRPCLGRAGAEPGSAASALRVSAHHPEGTRRCCAGATSASTKSACIGSGNAPSSRCARCDATGTESTRPVCRSRRHIRARSEPTISSMMPVGRVRP